MRLPLQIFPDFAGNDVTLNMTVAEMDDFIAGFGQQQILRKERPQYLTPFNCNGLISGRVALSEKFTGTDAGN